MTSSRPRSDTGSWPLLGQHPLLRFADEDAREPAGPTLKVLPQVRAQQAAAHHADRQGRNQRPYQAWGRGFEPGSYGRSVLGGGGGGVA
jgi:hypothetical protein